MSKIWYKKDPDLINHNSVYQIVDKYGIAGFGVVNLLFDEIAKSESRGLTHIAINRLKKTYEINDDLINDVVDSELFYTNKTGLICCDVIDEAIKAYDNARQQNLERIRKRWDKTQIETSLNTGRNTGRNTDKIRLDEIRSDKRELKEERKEAKNMCVYKSTLSKLGRRARIGAKEEKAETYTDKKRNFKEGVDQDGKF